MFFVNRRRWIGTLKFHQYANPWLVITVGCCTAKANVFMFIYLCVLKAVLCTAEDGIVFVVGNVVFLLENREEPSCMKKLVKRSQLLVSCC